MIAGKMTKSNTVGAVAAMGIPEVNRLVNAFFAGAKEVNPNVKRKVAFIGSFFDPPKAKEAAIAQIDALIKTEPSNPYFYELKGQALLEGGKPAEAIAPLRRAVQLSHNAPLIQMLLGQALVGTDNKAYADEAISILKATLAREPEAPLGYTQLAMAYGRKGNLAEADLASAQAAYLRGDQKTARDLASRAKTRFAIGSPGWVRADDIVNTKPAKN